MLDWIEEIDPQLFELEEKAQFKRARSFPLEKIESRLKQLFQDQTLTLKIKTVGWAATELLPNFQKEVYGIAISPLQESIFLTIDAGEVVPLLTEQSLSLSEEMKEGFITYFLTEILHLVRRTGAIQPLTLRITGQETLTESHYFQIDVGISGERGEVWGKLFLSKSFRKSWNEFFSSEPPLPYSEEQKERIPLVVGVQVGSTMLRLKELNKLEKGDFLLLRKGSFDPETKRGELLLTLKNRALFRAEVGKEGLIVKDLSPYGEVSMDEEEFEEEEEEEEFEDEDEDEEYEEDEYLDEDEEDFNFSEEKGEVEEAPLAEEAISVANQEVISPEKSVTKEIGLDEVDVQVVVEMCRLNLSAKEVLALSEGTLLNLDLPLDQGVDLMVNGKRFGRGELLRIGDLLGVRINHLTSK